MSFSIEMIDSMGLPNGLDAKTKAWRLALEQLPEAMHWERALSGQCDAFALMLGDHLRSEGLDHGFAVITRSTIDEEGHLDINHFSHAVVVTEDRLGGCHSFDAMGSGAIERFMNDWVDSPGSETSFDEIHFSTAQDFVEHLNTPISGYGRPKSNPTDNELLKAWRSVWAAQLVGSVHSKCVSKSLML